jgi:hypothetical protein
MKKSSKRIPKSHLPKYFPGGRTDDIRPSVDNSMYGSPESEGSMMGATQDMGGGTQNIYNQKRSFGNNIGQYAGYAQAALGTASALSDINNQGYDGNTKNYAQSQAVGNGITQAIGTINPLIAMGTGIRKSATEIVGDKSGAARTVSNWMAAPHEAAVSDISAANNSENSQSQKIGGYMSAIGDITGMSKMRQMFSYGTGNDEKTTGFWGKYNDLAGISARNNQKNSLGQEFAMGGMNMQPNAEIEKQENVVDPNGSFLQVDGSTHENGGVPVALPGNSMVFSDRLKLGKKTFAELNKVNNTNKEDKILESNKFGNTSKRTAELMKFAKNKNSQELFGAQEALKQAKVEAYAKKMGVTLPQAQEAPEEGMQYPMGGKLPMYHLGGPVDNTKFTPSQRQQAYNDSMTLYNSGLGNQANFKVPGSNDALHSLHLLNKKFPTPVSTRNVNTPAGTEVVSQYQKPVYNPSMVKKAKPVNYPMVNIPMKGLENPSLNFNPQLQQVPANSKPGSSKIEIAPNFSIKKRYDSQGNLVDKEYFDTMNPERQIETAEFRNGGRMLPKYAWGDLTPEQQFLKTKFMGAEQNQRNLAFNKMTGNMNPGYNTQKSAWSPEELQASSDEMISENYPEKASTTPLNQPNAYLIRKDKNGKLIFDNPNAYKAQKPFDFAAADARQQAEIDAVDKRKVTDPNDRNFDWGSLAQTGQRLGNFAMQNAGNIYDLTRKQDPLQKYARAKASFLDPSSAIRDALAQTRRAEYNIRNASGGNAGTYLANRVGLNAQNTENLARIHQNYANANAGIANQNSQFNTEIAYREAEAQAKDRAMRQNVNSQAIHSMASNFGKASKASKENSMDQKELDLFMYRYKNEPGFKEQVDKFRTA